MFVPLNDYTATVVGMVRDDVPFNTLLSADLVYIADGAVGRAGLLDRRTTTMYEAMDANNVDLKAHLVSSTQSALTGIAGGRDRRRHDHARRRQRLLHQRHQPRRCSASR